MEDPATIDKRLREEPWLLRNAPALIEAFPSGPDGFHRCKLCEDYVHPRDGERHFRAHVRRLDTLRRRSEEARRVQAIKNLNGKETT